MTDPNDSAEALASIRDARQRMLNDMETYPRVYDVWLSLAVGLIVVLQGLPGLWALLSIPLTLVLVFKGQAWWKARFGWWVDAYKPRKAGRIAFGLLAVMTALVLMGAWGRYEGPWWLSLIGGALAWPVSLIGARWWAAVWKRELREAA